jgi:hypothetical protein
MACQTREGEREYYRVHTVVCSVKVSQHDGRTS